MLVITTIIVSSSTNWVIIWIIIEINTVIICFIINKEIEKEKIIKYNSFIYYIVQCTASIIFLVSAYSSINDEWKKCIIIMAIMIKIGIWPFHRWYLKIISTLKIGNKSIRVLITIQKIIPIWSIRLNSNGIENMITLWCIINILISSIYINRKISIKSIIALRSIFNNSWIIISLSNISMWATYLTIYFIRVTIMLTTIIEIKKKNSIRKIGNTTTIALCCNIAGVPPLIIFSAKVIVIKFIVIEYLIVTRVIIVLINRLFSYHYIWIIRNSIIVDHKKSKTLKKVKETPIVLLLVIVSSATIIILF